MDPSQGSPIQGQSFILFPFSCLKIFRDIEVVGMFPFFSFTGNNNLRMPAISPTVQPGLLLL